MKVKPVFFVAILASAFAALAVAFAAHKLVPQTMSPNAVSLRVEGELPSLGKATEWINSPPLTPVELRGKVVLVDFWTYTCINWRRTLPYVRAWAEKYKNQGLVVFGVHSPGFDFEKNIGSVRRATKDVRIDYP